MPDSPNKLSQFWQELKRRNVHRSVAIYAGSSFVFLEAATIIFPRWGFPDWTIDLVLYLLILGAFITIIVSWIFDITPQGVQKTKPLEEITETEKPADSKVWKAATYISLVIIVALVILNIVPMGKTIKTGDIQSLVILPFDNFTGDDSLEYFVSGMHASLINDVGRLGGLRVICKTSSNVYKDVDMTASEIAKELNVDAVVETSVMCLGDSICVQYKVVDATGEERQLYIADIKEEKSRILGLFNRITRQIADEIMIELSPDEEQRLATSRTVDPEAYDAYLMGQFYWEKLDPESVQKALDYFQKAIDLDPEWADPYAGLANSWGLFGLFGFMPKSVTLPNTYKFLNKALELDPNSAQAHYVKAINAVWQEFDWEQGEKAFLRSLELNSNDALCRLYYAHFLMCMCRSEEALQQANLGLELDPLKPLVLGLYGVVMNMAGEHESAIQYFEKALAIDPNDFFSSGNLKATQMNAAYNTGDYERWFELWGEKVKGNWNEECRQSVLNAFEERGHIAGIEEMFKMHEKYGNKGARMTDGIKFERYLNLGEYNKAMDYLEEASEMLDMEMAYLATNLFYPYLRENPRYIELLKKMNLPLPEE